MKRNRTRRGTVERMNAERRRGIVTLRHAAKTLGVEHSHLRRVIIGERVSDVLLGRYQALLRDARTLTNKQGRART